MVDIKNQYRFSRENIINISNYISIFFCLFGILVRLVQYANNRSLWGDEASVALNIVDRSYLGLLNPLDYNQAAPPGFLWAEKLAIQIFGNNEYALRLFPFISSLISIYAFYLIANRYASKFAAPIAIAFFACLPYTVYYATEVKQYSSDVMVALLLTLSLVPIGDRLLTRKQVFLFSLIGAIFIWLSHPAIFVLAGIELVNILIALNNEQILPSFVGFKIQNLKSKIVLLIFNRLPIYLTWLFSFALLYFLNLSRSMGNSTLQDSWGPRFPDSPFDILWLLDALGRFFYRPLGFFSIADGIAMFAFVIGLIAYFKQQKKMALFFIMSPTIATVIASYLQKYPFRERLVLFLAPFFILVLAEGIVFLLCQFKSKTKAKYLAFLGVVIFAALLLPPLVNTSKLIVSPELKHEIRPVIAYIKSHQKPSDSIYVYHKAETQFLYYAPKYDYVETNYYIGRGDLPDDRGVSEESLVKFKQEIAEFRDKNRVWFLFSGAKDEEEKAFLDYLNPIGKKLDLFRRVGAVVYLYDLS